MLHTNISDPPVVRCFSSLFPWLFPHPSYELPKWVPPKKIWSHSPTPEPKPWFDSSRNSKETSWFMVPSPKICSSSLGGSSYGWGWNILKNLLNVSETTERAPKDMWGFPKIGLPWATILSSSIQKDGFFPFFQPSSYWLLDIIGYPHDYGNPHIFVLYPCAKLQGQFSPKSPPVVTIISSPWTLVVFEVIVVIWDISWRPPRHDFVQGA